MFHIFYVSSAVKKRPLSLCTSSTVSFKLVSDIKKKVWFETYILFLLHTGHFGNAERINKQRTKCCHCWRSFGNWRLVGFFKEVICQNHDFNYQNLDFIYQNHDFICQNHDFICQNHDFICQNHDFILTKPWFHLSKPWFHLSKPWFHFVKTMNSFIKTLISFWQNHDFISKNHDFKKDTLM